MPPLKLLPATVVTAVVVDTASFATAACARVVKGVVLISRTSELEMLSCVVGLRYVECAV